MLKFHRSVHTRSKKISVQLLQDFKHVGARGEIVQVAEGLMRNKLHPGNGAAYILDGPVIPVVKRQATIRAPKAAEPAAPAKASPGILDMLVFESEAEAAGEAEAKTAANARPAGKAVKTDFEWQNEFVKSK